MIVLLTMYLYFLMLSYVLVMNVKYIEVAYLTAKTNSEHLFVFEYDFCFVNA